MASFPKFTERNRGVRKMTANELAAWLRDQIATADGYTIEIEYEHLPALVEILDRAERLPRRPRKSHCKWGHALTGANVYRQKTGANRCRTCWRERARKAYRKRKGIVT